MTDNLKKQVVHLVYSCFLCENVFNGEQAILTHMNDTHGYHIPPRSADVQRPPDEKFLFRQGTSNNDFKLERYACPACWFHCKAGNIRALRLHTVHFHSYEGYDGESEHSEDNKENTLNENEQDLETQKAEFLNHLLVELDDLNLFLERILY